MQVFRKAQRPEVVDHRCAQTGTLGRHHPVGEVHDVEVAEELLRGRTPEGTPCAPGRVRERDGEEALLDRQAVERLVEQAAPADARGTERDDLAFRARRLEHALQRSQDVVADARSRMRERRDVVGDPHGAEYRKARKCTPRTRGSAGPGTAVGLTVNTARHTPPRGRSGTVRLAASLERNVTLLPSARTVCGPLIRFGSRSICAVTVPPVHRRRVYVTRFPDHVSFG